MNKKQREIIKQKYDGKCMYCGHALCDKFHIDHIKPIFRGRIRVPDNASNFDPNHGEDVIDNMGPACIPCNLWKKTFSVEKFRHEVEQQTKRLLERSGGFRLAHRFGLVDIYYSPVVFWFEVYNESKKYHVQTPYC